MVFFMAKIARFVVGVICFCFMCSACGEPNAPCVKTIVHYLDSKHTVKSHEEDVLCNDSSVRHGLLKVYERDGTIVGSTHYEYGKKNGYAYIFYPNGTISSREEYKGDTIAGLAMTFTSSGDTLQVVEYKDGKLYNVLYYKDEKGESMDYGSLKDGNGVFLLRDEKGRLVSIVTYTNGLPSGVTKYIHYDSLGNSDTMSFPVPTR